VAAWVVCALALLPAQSELQDRISNDVPALLPDGSESLRAFERVRDGFGATRATPAVVVWQRRGGLEPADRAAIARALAAIRADGAGTVRDLVSPLSSDGRRLGLVSGDGTTAAALVTIDALAIADLRPVVTGMRDELARNRPPGLAAHVTGPAGIALDAGDVLLMIDARLVAATAGLIVLLLLVIYRSLALAAVLLTCVLVAYGTAAGCVSLLAGHSDVLVSGVASGILVILVLGAGCDYCLLLVARFREALARGASGAAAAGEATRLAGPAIAASGATVAGAMLALGFASIPATRGLGPVLAIGVGVTVAASLTLLPALLAILGPRALWPAAPTRRARRGVWERIAALVGRRPRAVVAVTVLGLGLASLGLLVEMPSIGYGGGLRPGSDARAGQVALARALPAGDLAPVDVLVSASDELQRERAARVVSSSLAGSPSVARIRVAGTSTDGASTRLLVSLARDPYGGGAEGDVRAVRSVARAAARTEGAGVLVGGPSAQIADTRAAVSGDLRLIVPVTLIVIGLVLTLLLRALVAPIYLLASVVASFSAALGLSTLAFRYLLDSPGIDPTVPSLVFLFVVALGVDYTIFLMSRVREEVLAGHATGEATLRALAATGGVITSAGVILAGTFGVLMLLPLEALLQIGLAVALGVLIDALIVRPLLVPALAVLLGERSWWPYSGGMRRPP